MRPLTIRARNFRTWAELDLDVPAGITAIVGPNGAGKSSLVEVVDLALFGTGRELQRATTRGFDDVSVELVFEHAGDRYAVRRERRKAKPTLEFFRIVHEEHVHTWEGLNRGTMSETQERIEEILGLSRQTFRASSFLAQGDGAAFTEAEPRDRKAILLDALGVRVWDRLKEKATEIRSTQEKLGDGMRVKVAHLEERLVEKANVERAHGIANSVRDRLSVAIEGTEADVVKLREEAEAAERLVAERRLLQEKLNAACAALSGLDERAIALRGRIAGNNGANLVELRAKIARVPDAERMIANASETAKLDATLTGIEAREAVEAEREKRLAERTDVLVEQLAEAQNELADLVECPTCKRPLDDPEAHKHATEALRARVRALEDEQGETLKHVEASREEAARLAGERAPLDTRVRDLLSERHVLVEKIGVRPELALAEAREAERALAVAESVDVSREELSAVEEERVRLNAEKDALIVSVDEVPVGPDRMAARRALVEAESRLLAERASLREAEAHAASLNARLDLLVEHEQEHEQLRRQLDALDRELEVLRLAERAFGRDGVPALILETSAIPQIEHEANRIVSALGREYRFELRTQRETQAGGVKDVLDVVVHTGAGEAVYEDFSGGEKTRLDLSLRIALARLLAARRGSDVRLLAIDEPAYLDEEGFAQLAAVLRDLAGEFDSILVVSHVDTLRDAFDNAIVVNGGADTGQPSRLGEE